MLNVDIKEAKDKPPKQARLQAPLRIELAPNDEEQYDDLDEIVARYVAMFSTLCRALVCGFLLGGGVDVLKC